MDKVIRFKSHFLIGYFTLAAKEIVSWTLKSAFEILYTWNTLEELSWFKKLISTHIETPSYYANGKLINMQLSQEKSTRPWALTWDRAGPVQRGPHAIEITLTWGSMLFLSWSHS